MTMRDRVIFYDTLVQFHEKKYHGTQIEEHEQEIEIPSNNPSLWVQDENVIPQADCGVTSL